MCLLNIIFKILRCIGIVFDMYFCSYIYGNVCILIKLFNIFVLIFYKYFICIFYLFKGNFILNVLFVLFSLEFWFMKWYVVNYMFFLFIYVIIVGLYCLIFLVFNVLNNK